jgi:2-methylcitrate dehydratase PrpD
MGDQLTNNVSQMLARFVAEAKPLAMPDKVRHEAKRALMNYFAAALGGCLDRAIKIAARVLGEFAGAGEAAVIGRGVRTDPLTAAFLNAASGNVFDFDDTHIPTVIHPTAPVAPALFALAALRRVSGAELLHAFVLGVEIECRLGNLVSPGHYRRGWHITSTCGVFGAAAAAGKLLGLDAEHMNWALGNASAQSSGLIETLGHMSKSIGVGNSARGGLLAALLAECGFAGPEQPLEGPRGFMAVMGGQGCDVSSLTRGLGETWEILRNTYKPYPCGVVLNAVIDGVFELRERYEIRPERVRGVVVTGHPLLGERTNRPTPASGREAQVSAQHSVAAVLLRGAAGIAEFSDAAVADPAVVALRSKVTVVDDPTMVVGTAKIAIDLGDGAIPLTIVDHARGSLERPLTDIELEQKLVTLAASGCPGLNVEPLIKAVWSIEDVGDVQDVMRHAVFDSRPQQ